MPTLDYRPPRFDATDSPAPLHAIVVPILATWVAIYAWWHNGYHEPFFDFSYADAAIQVGCPLVSLALWIIWVITIRRLRLALFPVVAILLWATLQLTGSLLVGVSYFEEPWAAP